MAASVRLRTNPHVWEQPRSFINAGLHRETLNDDILEAAYFALPARRAVVETMAEPVRRGAFAPWHPSLAKGARARTRTRSFQTALRCLSFVGLTKMLILLEMSMAEQNGLCRLGVAFSPS